MLTITPAASAALASLMQSPTVPDGAGLRLAQGVAPSGEPEVGLAIVSGPEPDDAVVDAGAGVDLFVEPETADLLDDRQLDAERDGEQITFSFRRQNFDGDPGSESRE